MKKKISKILGVGLVTGLLLSLLLAAVPVAATVSQPMVDPANDDVSATNVYTISFQITEELAVGDYIMIQFPEDTDTSAIGDAVADIVIAATSGIGSDAFDNKSPDAIADITVDDDDLTVKFLLPAAFNATGTIGAMASVQVKIADVENPTEPGDYVLSVKTEEETTYKESAAYEIESPTVGGGIYIYNASDVLVETYGGSAALVNAFDAGWLGKEDFTITVGPGTYKLTKDIAFTADDITLEASGDASDTEIDCNELYGITIGDGGATIEGEDVVIDGFKINDATVAVSIEADDFTIRNCDIVDADGGDATGIVVTVDGTDAVIENCTFDDCPVAIEFEDMAATDLGVKVKDCTIGDCSGTAAILFNGGNEDVDITGCTISGNDSNGIEIDDGAAACDDIVIKGNTISANEDDGIFIDTADAVTKLEISENTIADNDSDGIQIADGWTEVSCVIMFNNFSGNTSDHVQNDTDVDMNAYFNYWGAAEEDDFSSKIEETDDGDIEYDPWLTAEFGTTASAGDVKMNATSLDAKSTVGASVSGVEDDADLKADVIALTKYAENPGEELEDAIAFFDVFVKLDDDYDTEDETIKIKLYDAAIAEDDAAYFWTGDFWVACSDQTVRSGVIWISASEDSVPAIDELEETAFAVVAGAGEAAAEDAVTVPALTTPALGETGIALSPVFSWAPVPDAAKYEIALARAPFAKSFTKTPLISSEFNTVSENVTYPPIKLDYGTTYFWKVRVSSPEAGEWSPIASFTTMEEPEEEEETPTEIIVQAPDVTVEQPTTTTPAYIWAIIAIGAVLAVAVLILIVRTRRVG